MHAQETSAPAALGTGSSGRSRDEVREDIRLTGSNVNPESLLATDYLNHFNEIIMLLDLAAEMPDCFEDAAAWQPMSYHDHFRRSNLADRDLAVEAYELCPPDIRWRFDKTVSELDTRLLEGIELCLTMLETIGAEAFKMSSAELAADARSYIDKLSAIIHGTDGHVPVHGGLETESLEDAQQTIDSLFGD